MVANIRLEAQIILHFDGFLRSEKLRCSLVSSWLILLLYYALNFIHLLIIPLKLFLLNVDKKTPNQN